MTAPALLAAFAPLLTLVAGVTPDAGWASRSAEVMATRLDVTVPAARVADAEVVFAVFRDVEARMNEWRRGSPLAEVNAAAGAAAAVSVPADLRALLRRGLEIGRLTAGAFDVTWAALWGVWDFRAEAPRPPAAAEIDRRLPLIDYRKVEVDDTAGTVRLPAAGMKLGLGGIAKGYALERAAAALRARGLDHFMMSAGGQVYAAGLKGDRPWRVGVRDPRGPADDWFAVLEVTDASVSTSGDYERFFLGADGRRYHHILDPRTGRPARGLRSATVLAADPTLADALSTALMVLGADAGLALVERLDDVECVLVDAAGHVRLSAGASGSYTLRHAPRR